MAIWWVLLALLEIKGIFRLSPWPVCVRFHEFGRRAVSTQEL
jgi:hypothetical protein